MTQRRQDALRWWATLSENKQQAVYAEFGRGIVTFHKFGASANRVEFAWSNLGARGLLL